jgi:hypothetical protein
MAEPINGGLSPQGREELRLVASLGLGHVIAQEAERKAKDILRGSKGSLNDTLLTMAKTLTELIERHVALERHVVELETKMLTDGGVWNAETVYQPGALVTDHGAPWICLEMNSNTRPPSDCWRLVGKSHR